MHKRLFEDLTQIDTVLTNVVREANRFLSELNRMPAGAILLEHANADSNF